MPIYEYRCENCGHELEAIQKISEEPLRRCPECDTDGLVKRVSAAGFRLKGGGWYETDFKSGNKRNVSGEKSSGEGASTSTGTEKSTSGKSGAADSGSSSGSGKTSTGSSKSD